MLVTAVIILGLVAFVGMGLGSLTILLEKSPKPYRFVGYVHGASGAVGVVLMLLALRGPVKGVHMGVGSFGFLSGALLSAALLAGLTILLKHVRGGRASSGLIVTHSLLGVTGYTILATYFTMTR